MDSYDDVVFPLDSCHPSLEQRVTIARADDVLLRDCMRRYGFDYELPDRTAEPLENRVIGVIDKDSAARYGYKPAGYLEHANQVEEAKNKQPTWTPEMMSVLNGNGKSRINGVAAPEGGCGAEAQAKLGVKRYGKPGDENFVFGLEGMSSDMAEADSRLKAAFEKWSGCMADAGFNYRDPWQASRAFVEDVATQAEIDTATLTSHVAPSTTSTESGSRCEAPTRTEL